MKNSWEILDQWSNLLFTVQAGSSLTEIKQKSPKAAVSRSGDRCFAHRCVGFMSYFNGSAYKLQLDNDEDTPELRVKAKPETFVMVCPKRSLRRKIGGKHR